MSDRPHVMVIDDEAFFRNSLSAALRSDFFVSLAEDGQDAYTKAVQNKPQLAIVDMVMPKFDGLTTIRMFRRDLRLADIPFVVLTSDATRETVVACAKARVKAYVLKSSLKYSEFVNTIRELLAPA